MKKFKYYKITCLDNGMIYVGRTERTLQERFQEHSWNKKSYLGRAMRAHGKDRLTIELLAECDDFDKANELERYYIKEFDCKRPKGYNLTDGGDGRAGCPHTPEEIAKIKRANKGQVPWIKGKHHKEETKRKIAASLMGHEVPQSVRDKIAAKLLGRKRKKD